MSDLHKQHRFPTHADKGALLLRIARASIEQTLGTGALHRPQDAPWLADTAATFVTLEKRGELRGCIGVIEAIRSLYEDVTENARNAAFADPRFEPLRIDELESIRIEVSLLSPLERLSVASEKHLLETIETGHHGLLIRLGSKQSTFLPSVWQQLPDPRDFVARLKEKAGISMHYWSDDIEVLTYTAEKFSESKA